VQNGALIDCIVKGYVLTAHQTNDMQWVFRKLRSIFDKHKVTKFKAPLQWDVKPCSLVEVYSDISQERVASFFSVEK
jgi:hypothetical protein